MNSSEIIRICSIDPGFRNCAFYVEEFFSNDLLYNGKRILWEVVDFDGRGERYTQLFQFLLQHFTIWQSCSAIIIERQLNLNPKAQLIQGCLFGFFKYHFGPFKHIDLFSAANKTRVLRAPKMPKKADRKNWAITKSLSIFVEQNDHEGCKKLSGKKNDDLADAYLQLKAFRKLSELCASNSPL